MRGEKHILQKLALASAVLSFLLAAVSGVFLYLRPGQLGDYNPVNASLMAATFFFLCVGAVLLVMGLARLPSFRFDKQQD